MELTYFIYVIMYHGFEFTNLPGGSFYRRSCRECIFLCRKRDKYRDFIFREIFISLNAYNFVTYEIIIVIDYFFVIFEIKYVAYEKYFDNNFKIF